ncbi:MAG: hypothetical protein QFB87_02380 [Patescibacteria group bacterium]|nr:hypothetical protein [Patescibacteria group bacterium]
MTNYLLLYHGGGMPSSDEEKDRIMQAWGVWMEQVGENLVDAGNPTGLVRHVDSEGVSDFAGARVTGYSIVKANNMDEAIRCASMVPLVADGGSVDVYETIDAM